MSEETIRRRDGRTDYVGDVRPHATSTAAWYSTACAEFDQTHRSGGSFGLSLIEVDQPAIDNADVVMSDVVFAQVRTGGRDVHIDVGDGLTVSRRVAAGAIGVYPGGAATRTIVSGPHALSVAGLPSATVARTFAEAGLGHDPLGERYATMASIPEAARLMGAMWCVSERAGPMANLLLDGLTLQFLSAVANEGSLSPLGSAPREDVRIRRAIDYLETYLATSLTVAELANVATMSPSHFARAFKATTGEAVWRYVQRRRCERAVEMLRRTALPIGHVAEDCGFSTQSHLTRALRQRFGATPAAIRRAGFSSIGVDELGTFDGQ